MNENNTKLLEKLRRGIDRNLPTILTGVGVISGIATIGFAVYAGWKIHETVEDESKDTKQKAKNIAKVSIPVAAGAAVATTCTIAANKQNLARLAAASSVIAVSKIDKEETKKKIEDMTGIKFTKDEDKKDQKTEVIATPPNVSNLKVRMKDGMTGLRFEASMNDFWKAVALFNAEMGEDTSNMLSFYEKIIGDERGIDYMPVYENMKFGGYENNPPTFQPRFTHCEIDGDMQPVYVFVYDYSDVKYVE